MEESNRAKRIKIFLGWLRISIISLLAIFIIILVFVNKNQISVDNFKRLLARFDFTFGTSSNISTITFSADDSNAFSVFKNGLSVISAEGLKIYDGNGNEFTSIQTVYKSPSIQTSKKFVLSYDRGGKVLNISNSFTALFNKTFDDRIINACINDNGYLAAITETSGYKHMINVFNSNFNEVSKLYFSDRYIVNCAISQDNSSIAIISLATEESSVNTLLSVYKIGAEKPLFEIKIEDDIAFEIQYKNGSNIEIISQKKAYYYSKTGTLLNTVDFIGGMLDLYTLSNSSTAFICRGISNEYLSHVIVTDEKGNKLAESPIEENIIDCTFCDNNIALLSENSVGIYKTQRNELVKVKDIKLDETVNRILGNGNSVFLISKTHAVATKI